MTDGTLTFWGCRGSIPAPGPRTVVFGGNTSCVSIEYQSLVLIFDAGSGIRALGRYLLAREDIRQIRGCIFLTHTHWDHIQGLPFFTPAFSAKNRFAIYGEGNRKLSLVEVLEDQMHAPYFPVEMDRAYGAIVTFHEVHPRQKIVLDGEVTVAPFRLTHPNLAVGCVMKVADVRVAYVTDHAHETGRLARQRLVCLSLT